MCRIMFILFVMTLVAPTAFAADESDTQNSVVGGTIPELSQLGIAGDVSSMLTLTQDGRHVHPIAARRRRDDGRVDQLRDVSTDAVSIGGGAQSRMLRHASAADVHLGRECVVHRPLRLPERE